MQPDSTRLIEILGITPPLIGFYDAPEASSFKPLATPGPRRHVCIFSFYEKWRQGVTLHITKDNFGCSGAGYWMCGITTRSREDLVTFLVDGEGLKASRDLMNRWLDHRKGYRQEYPDIFIGPLRNDQYEYLQSVTFFVNPDQLSALMLGAQYNNAPDDPIPVIAPFGSGYMELISLFDDLTVPQAIIGGTDIAARPFLPPDILAFTVTRPMFKQLCELDEKSFLYKPFWKNLRNGQ